MSGKLTMFAAGELLNSFFGRGATPPQEWYLAMIKDVAPTPYINGAELDEPSPEDSYQRALIPNEVNFFSNAGSVSTTTLATDVVFTTATTGWGTLRYWALTDALTGGNCYLVGALETAVHVQTGDTLMVQAGELDIEVGPFFSSWDV